MIDTISISSISLSRNLIQIDKKLENNDLSDDEEGTGMFLSALDLSQAGASAYAVSALGKVFRFDESRMKVAEHTLASIGEVSLDFREAQRMN